MSTFTMEEIQAVLDEVRAYYPEDVWPEFTAGEKNVSRDRVSASMARRTVDNTRRLFRERAKEKTDIKYQDGDNNERLRKALERIRDKPNDAHDVHEIARDALHPF